MITIEESVTRLREAQEEIVTRLREAKEDRERAEADIKNAVYDSLDAGLSISAIARMAGISRQTVYTWKEQGHDPC